MTIREILDAMGDMASEAEALAMLDILRQRGIENLNEIPDDEFFTLIPAAVEAAEKGATR